jgi:hypothetical protein
MELNKEKNISSQKHGWKWNLYIPVIFPGLLDPLAKL